MPGDPETFVENLRFPPGGDWKLAFSVEMGTECKVMNSDYSSQEGNQLLSVIDTIKTSPMTKASSGVLRVHKISLCQCWCRSVISTVSLTGHQRYGPRRGHSASPN